MHVTKVGLCSVQTWQEPDGRWGFAVRYATRAGYYGREERTAVSSVYHDYPTHGEALADGTRLARRVLETWNTDGWLA